GGELGGKDLRRAGDHLCRAAREGRTVVAALGGHVIKTGCAPYLIDWVRRGLVSAVVLNGAAAIHDVELAVGGKTSEDVAAQLPAGRFGMAREAAAAFSGAAPCGAGNERGLGRAPRPDLDGPDRPHAGRTPVLAAHHPGSP